MTSLINNLRTKASETTLWIVLVSFMTVLIVSLTACGAIK